MICAEIEIYGTKFLYIMHGNKFDNYYTRQMAGWDEDTIWVAKQALNKKSELSISASIIDICRTSWDLTEMCICHI